MFRGVPSLLKYSEKRKFRKKKKWKRVGPSSKHFDRVLDEKYIFFSFLHDSCVHTTKWPIRMKVSGQVFDPKNQSRFRLARSKFAQIFSWVSFFARILTMKFGPIFFFYLLEHCLIANKIQEVGVNCFNRSWIAWKGIKYTSSFKSATI